MRPGHWHRRACCRYLWRFAWYPRCQTVLDHQIPPCCQRNWCCHHQHPGWMFHLSLTWAERVLRQSVNPISQYEIARGRLSKRLASFPSIWSFPKPRIESTSAFSRDTKPNPLLRPVSLSNITVESTTLPNWEKNSRMDSEVTLPASPPMNNFVARWCSCLGIARLGSI